MNIQLLYLSDLHIADETTLPETRVEDMINALQLQMPFDYCIILISGDIVYSGKVQEYEIAYRRIEGLTNKIKSKFSLENVEVLLVPGNHDNDFSDISVNRSDIAQIMDKESNYFHEYQKLSAFYSFARKFNCFTKNKIAEVKRLQFGTYQLQCVLVNSAIYSAFKDNLKQNEKGLHYMPHRAFTQVERFTKSSNLCIYISHHSPEWFDEDSKHMIEEYIERNCTLAVWGHEHYYCTYKNGAEIIKGGVLSGQNNDSDFYTILIDTTTNQLKTNHFVYNNRDRIYIKTEMGNQQISCSGMICPNKQYLDTVINVAIPSLHCKSHDIFVAPRMLNKSNSFDLKKELLTMEQLIDALDEVESAVITGDELCGKTTLLKELYLKYVSDGFAPLYLNPESLKGKKIDKIVKYNFWEQYEEDESYYQRFLCLPREKKILLIDDVHLITTKKLFDEFIRGAKSQFSKIIIASSVGEFDINEIIKSNIEDASLLRLSIAPFYVDKRKELIEVVLRAMESFSKDEIIRYVNQIDQTIQNQLKYFSLTPQFIIMFVECFVNQTFALDGNSNVFNAVFQANITNMIKSIATINVPRCLQLLQQLAYMIHINRTYPLSYSKFVDIVDEYNREHTNAISAQNFSMSLERVGMIKLLENDSIVFASNNYLAYFVAQALNSKLGTDEGNEQIQYLLANICFEINADILLFLSFLTNRKEIIGFILNECDNFLNQWDECDLDNQNIKCLFVDFNAPAIAYPTSEQKARRTRDVIEHEKKILNSETIQTTDIYNYDPNDITFYINKQTKVLKLLEITSKILPNFEHILNKQEMKAIVDKIYSIPNKLIYYMLRPFDDNFEEAVEELVEAVNKFRSEEDIIDKSKGVILMQDFFTAMILSLYDFAARLSVSKETYELLLDNCYSKSLSNKIQQCLVMYQSEDFEKLGKQIESIFDGTKYQSIKFMMIKIARNYLIKHDVPYVHYGQKFIDRFFPDRKKLLLEKGKLKQQ